MMDVMGALDMEQMFKYFFMLLMVYPMYHAVRFAMFMILPRNWVKAFFC